MKLWVVAALLVPRLVVAALLVFGPWTDSPGELDGWDADRFHEIATEPGRPWVDHEVEYPPGSVVLAELVSSGSVVRTHRLVVVVALVADLAVAAVVGRRWGRRPMTIHLALGLSLLPTMYLRFDLVATLFAVMALAVLPWPDSTPGRAGWAAAGASPGVAPHRREHDLAFGVALTLGFLVKTWPVVLLGAPLAARRPRAAVAAAGGIAVSLALWVACAGLEGPRQVATFRGAEGWHIESLAGSIMHLVTGSTVVLEEGAYRFGAVPSGFRVLAMVAMAAGWSALWHRCRRNPGGGPHLAVVGSVSLLLATSTLLSPQFLVWLLPFAAVAWSTADVDVRALIVVTIVGSGGAALLINPADADATVAGVVFALRGLALLALAASAYLAMGHRATTPTAPRPAPTGPRP